MILLDRCNKIAGKPILDDHSKDPQNGDGFVLSAKRQATGMLRQKNFVHRPVSRRNWPFSVALALVR
jgi:hypothetical protein